MSSTKGASDFQPDRRWHIRYPVHGSLVLNTGERHYSAQPLTLSLGGISFRGEAVPPVEASGRIELNVNGFEETIFANIRVIRNQGNIAAAIFVLPPPPLVRCIAWLAGRTGHRS